METTNTNKLSNEIFNAICDCGYLPRSYSGRCMYGRECLAFDVINGDSLYAAMIELMCYISTNHSDDWEELDDFIEALKTVKSDSMGRDTVMYFPDVPFVSPDVDD